MKIRSWCFGLAAIVLGSALAPVAAQTPRPVIAVLPLENNSGDAAQDFFAGGLTDEIAVAADLGRRSRRGGAVFCIPASSPTATSRPIGETLQCALSRARRGPPRRRPRAPHHPPACRPATARQLWSQEYDGDRGDIFDLEEDIAGTIATALKVPASPTEALVRSRTGDFDAYLDFLRAKVAARPRGAKPLADAAVLLERVVAREPDFAPAAALLAYGYALTPLFAPSLRGGMPQEERKIVERTIPRSDALARRATQLDPKSAEGVRGARLRQHGAAADGGGRGRVQQALALNPNQADGLHGLSQLLAALGRIKESLAMREHLQAGEQFITNYTADTAEIYLARRRHREGGRHAAAVPSGPHARARAGARPRPGATTRPRRRCARCRRRTIRPGCWRRRRRFSTPRRRRPPTRRRCRGSAI